ncbi:unnamed protein product [Lepidochelys kempii]
MPFGSFVCCSHSSSAQQPEAPLTKQEHGVRQSSPWVTVLSAHWGRRVNAHYSHSSTLLLGREIASCRARFAAALCGPYTRRQPSKRKRNTHTLGQVTAAVSQLGLALALAALKLRPCYYSLVVMPWNLGLRRSVMFHLRIYRSVRFSCVTQIVAA